MPDLTAVDFRAAAEKLRNHTLVTLDPEGREALADWLDAASLDASYMDADEPECRLVAALLQGVRADA